MRDFNPFDVIRRDVPCPPPDFDTFRTVWRVAVKDGRFLRVGDEVAWVGPGRYVAEVETIFGNERITWYRSVNGCGELITEDMLDVVE